MTSYCVSTIAEHQYYGLGFECGKDRPLHNGTLDGEQTGL